MNRARSLQQILSHDDSCWDIAIIGGGATGMGIAVDAASRGYSVCLFEQSDFGKGTSSRSTKLIHGGVRYLQQGNVALVMEALKERGILRNNAPHLVHDLAFIVPNYSWWEAPFYGIGMKVYDMLAGKFGFGHSRLLDKEQVLAEIPTLEQSGLRGGVLYYDGQFDDARLLINLAQTADELGAKLLNYARVLNFTYDTDRFITGFEWEDLESRQKHSLRARAIINATGAFSDTLRKVDDPDADLLIEPSQGVHLVLDRSFLAGNAAIMVPRTTDHRVMFAIPWHDHALLGTTDTPIQNVTLEPKPMQAEIAFLLETASRYLSQPPTRSDILSVFTGIRPLVRSSSGNTAALSREHTIDVSKSGLISIAGGKWTTYRRMAEDCIDHAALLARLEERPCTTRELKIHGYHEVAEQFGELSGYGSDAEPINNLIANSLIAPNPIISDANLARRLHKDLPIVAAQVIWAVREEMARTVDDVLARRTRALFLNARAAISMAPEVARLMALELNKDEAWQRAQVAEFNEIAGHYLPPDG